MKSDEFYVEDTIYLLKGEICPLYERIEDSRNEGECRLDGNLVSLEGGCRCPESCQKVSDRGLKVKFA